MEKKECPKSSDIQTKDAAKTVMGKMSPIS